VATVRCDRRLGRSATRVIGLRYAGSSPWTTLYVNTAILNSILSGSAQPMEAGQRVGDAVESPQVIG